MITIPGSSTPEENAPKENTYRWATVQGLGPLIIRFDGDTENLAITPDSLVPESDLIVGARVWCQIYGRHVIVLGTPYRAPAPDPEPEIDGTLADKTYYEKYPDGLLICRGTHNFPSAAETNQSYAWTFPVPFVGALPMVTAIGQSTVPYNYALGALDVTLSSVAIRFYRVTPAATTTFFQAIGRWK